MLNSSINILLVEDNAVDIKAVERAFRAKKISNTMHIAHDGLKALEILRGSNSQPRLVQPYIVFLDLNMPRMNGFEFLAEIRNDEILRRSIVFVLTTSEDDRDKVAAYDLQVAGYLSKNDAGGDFLNVIALLETFQTAVHFPPDTTV